MGVNLSSDEFDNTADTREGICSPVFSQHLAHLWEFTFGLNKKSYNRKSKYPLKELHSQRDNSELLATEVFINKLHYQFEVIWVV